jgi:hypothetical protein
MSQSTTILRLPTNLANTFIEVTAIYRKGRSYNLLFAVILDKGDGCTLNLPFDNKWVEYETATRFNQKRLNQIAVEAVTSPVFAQGIQTILDAGNPISEAGPRFPFAIDNEKALFILVNGAMVKNEAVRVA